ncbi:TetR family transcriptional regulator [Nocardia sp. NPDC050712]|uniref:TetR/AcrR family transcriptional regulator n=1 Tax=Nocardia sp. NPDC050712 TaxID=3155518 RepID=UPI0033D62877
MPKKTSRRELLADAALSLIDREGLSQVTHRAIDTAAGVPAGTTSNYFRTRAALYQAIAQRLLELQLAEIDRITTPADTDPADLLAALADPDSSVARNRLLARTELTLAAARDPELAELMRRLRASALRQLTAILRARYRHSTDEQIDALGSVFTGIALDRIALGVPGMDPRALFDAICAGLLQSSE